ncbi:hypothetical protein Poli38472_005162 [Pythium oligandrum]|uniref:RNA helicase n=1 Tax=Pythium oligandrum TaxID=41045 RepID=A0A8K1CFJ6_PYTOL|nr:hypothetical protein Poli38472_005162 [Pythium oligandrum]|eukprot:TMW62544.1 hypothetical protein Poli38472_005162 [Pythium oligandrum]
MDLQRSYLHNARRKARQTRDYFDDDDEDEGFSQRSSDRASEARQNGVLGGSGSAGTQENSDDIDPLDAFMAGIDVQDGQALVLTQSFVMQPTRFEDDHDSYLEELARTHKKPRATADYADSDEEVYATAKDADGANEADDDEDDGSKRTIEALAPLDHTTVEYETFRKAFYKVHPSVAAMSAAEIEELKKELSVHTEGSDVPRPIQSFMHAGFDRKMLAMLMKLELEAPTPIQSQTFPVALSGRDMIGIAKTGSGKTLAFALPMVVHVMDQRELLKDEGPIAIVLSPTRELAHQIFVQVKKFLTVYGAQCAAVYGGVGKWDQIQALRRGAEVVVATPGRLIDMIRKKNVKTRRVTFVVLDEADRMFEMGFEPQLRSIMGQVRPDRQTLMFSATFRKRIEALARDVLQDPVKVVIGKIGQANEDIRQVAVVVNNHNGKWPWLMANIRKLAAEGRLLIFAGSKVGCEELTKNLNAMQFYSTCLHGDKGQQERSEALAKFRSGECSILVATDVAARGLDVKDVKNVINYDVAKNIDTHVHRIGRTGRMGAEGFEPGTAYTLVTMKDTQFASQLVYNMDVSGQTVSNELLSLAKKDPRFRRGVPATAKHSSGGGYATEDDSNGLFESNNRIFDEEDERELERWTANKPKSKAEQRKGLGFAGPVGGRPSFVRPTAGSLQQSFRMGFVKATTTESSPQNKQPEPTFLRHAIGAARSRNQHP